jgi:hypothetical protein
MEVIHIWKKYIEPRISTTLAIQIDWSDEYKNALNSIALNRETDSNVIDESDLQLENVNNQVFQHCLESKSIEMMNVEILVSEFVSTVNLIQMKLIKMIYNWKNNWK